MVLFQQTSERRSLTLTRWVLSLFCAASVAGCAQGAGAPPMGSTQSTHSALRSQPPTGSNPIIYAFTGAPDGSFPYAGLIDVGGTLYGTTGFGGTEGGSGGGYGTVFSVTLGGSETILHSFAGGTDGIRPYAGLIEVKGTLYGTTSGGGSSGAGTVFSITTSGKEKVLYTFGTGGNGDGQTPYAGLLYVNGALYGTTIGGGSAGDGTVFELALSGTNAGKETVLHSFTGGSDGYGPQAALIQYKGALYGTTFEGGDSNDGTVFKVTPSGHETVVHAFAGPPDGSNPVASLLAYQGDLYGMTEHGGAQNIGTVFKMTPPKGKLTVIHSFTNVADEGWNPLGADLINVNGTFYGTVSFTNTGSGGVFEITPSGSESLVYVFNGNDGGPSAPYSGVINVGSMLYGTTINGGPAQAGTVYGVPL